MIRIDVTLNAILARTLRSVSLTRTPPAPWDCHPQARSIEAIIRELEDEPGALNGVDIQGSTKERARPATVWASPPARWARWTTARSNVTPTAVVTLPNVTASS
jgi:hypothetical protein